MQLLWVPGMLATLAVCTASSVVLFDLAAPLPTKRTHLGFTREDYLLVAAAIVPGPGAGDEFDFGGGSKAQVAELGTLFVLVDNGRIFRKQLSTPSATSETCYLDLCEEVSCGSLASLGSPIGLHYSPAASALLVNLEGGSVLALKVNP